MRRWGIVISAFYLVLLVALLLPAGQRLAGESWLGAYTNVFGGRPGVLASCLTGLLVFGQALLLFVTVDTSWRRLRPRQHIAVSAGVAGLFVGFLTLAAISSVWAAISDKSITDSALSPWSEHRWYSGPLPWVLGLWAVWGTVFYAYLRAAPVRLAHVVSWLLRASVLELLIAVPAHVVVRRRDDCSAPAVTAFGIGTGIAVMLACFGPGVLALYAERIRRYRAAHA